ncbi:hypothetical protein ACVWZR_006789 [Bradyrhizobium sp. i1.3.1]
MDRKTFLVGIMAAACLVALTPGTGHAQADPRVTKSMETLKAMTAKLGAPKLEGREAVGGKDAPALHFGTTKINNNFDIVDAVGSEDGKGMTATLFAKDGGEYRPSVHKCAKTRWKRPSSWHRPGRASA